MKGKYLAQDKLKKVERTIAKKVPAKEVRAWMAHIIEGGKKMEKKKMQSAQQTRELCTKEARISTIMRAGQGKMAHLHDIQQRIRNWTDKRLQQKRGSRTPHITNPMYRTMVKGLAKTPANPDKQPRTAPQVRAAIAIMAAAGEITVEWAVRETSHKEKSWEQEAKKTIQENGWMTHTETEQMIKKARKNITNMEQTPIAIDFTEGWGGTKEGMQRVMKTYGNDIVRQYKGKKEGHTSPDTMMDFAAQSKCDAITRALKATGVNVEDLVMVHFSPDCTSNSILNRIEKTQGRGRGMHAGLPREDDETITRMVRSILIVQTMARNKMTYVVEQPEGSALETHPMMEALGNPIRVHQCCYGQKHCKPTTLWTNLYPRYWKPRPFQRGTCIHCEACNEGKRHEEGLMRRGPGDTAYKPPTREGFTSKAMRNRINPNLAEILAKAAMWKWRAESGT